MNRVKFVRIVPKHSLSGDFNFDNIVSLTDFNIWAINFGTSGVDWTAGDATGDLRNILRLRDYNPRHSCRLAFGGINCPYAVASTRRRQHAPSHGYGEAQRIQGKWAT